jgi:hypothetical protein
MFSADNRIVLIKILILLPCGQWPSHRPLPPTSRYATTHSGEDGVTTDIILIKIQPDATVCRYLFTAKSLYVFRVSEHPSSGVLKTVTAASGTGHNIGTATSLQRGQCDYIFLLFIFVIFGLFPLVVTIY